MGSPVKTLLRHIPPVVRLKNTFDHAMDQRRFLAEFDAFKGLTQKAKERFRLEGS